MNSNPRKQLQQNPQNYKLHYSKGRIRKYYGPGKDHISTVFLAPPHIQYNAEPFNINKANGQFFIELAMAMPISVSVAIGPHSSNICKAFPIGRRQIKFSLGAGTNKNTWIDALRRTITSVFTY